jgi:hypothetical protein
MAGEGSMMGAIISLRNNKALRNNGKRANWKDYVGTKDIPTDDPIKASPELLAEIRTRIQIEEKKRKKQQILYAFLSLIFTLLIIYGISKLEWIGINLKQIV